VRLPAIVAVSPSLRERPNPWLLSSQLAGGRGSHRKKVAAALPFAGVEPRFDGVHHHRRERHLLIERVLPDALVEVHWEVNRCLAQALAVLGAYARLFLGSATTGASRGERRNRRWRHLGGARHGLERWLCVARDRMNGRRRLGDDLGVGCGAKAPSPIDLVMRLKSVTAEIASVDGERFLATVRSCSPSSTSFLEKGMVRL
jgi:hypothetical protein